MRNADQKANKFNIVFIVKGEEQFKSFDNIEEA